MNFKKLMVVLLTLTLIFPSLSFALNFSVHKFKIYTGDTNSDGYTDIYVRRVPDVRVFLSGQTRAIAFEVDESYLLVGDASGNYLSMVADETVDHTFLTEQTNLSLGDFNADGRTDLLIQSNDNARASVLLVAQAAGAALVAQFKEINGQLISSQEGTLTLEDTNLDGYADLVFDPTSGPEVEHINLATGAFGFALERVTTYTYTTAGMVATVDGPRTDVNDVTTYTYDANDELWKVTNALNHVVEIVSRDARGYPSEIKDANNVTTLLEYDPRGNLSKRTVQHPTTPALDAVTEYDYNVINLLEKITLPDGSFLEYFYDNAHRLEAIQNSYIGSGTRAERIEFELDNASNPLEDRYYDTSEVLVQKTIRQFDELSRLYKLKDNAGTPNETAFDYDLFGNQTDTTDALAQVTKQKYDRLNRIKELEDAKTNSAFFEYDDRGNLTKVTDQRGIETTYTYDANDNLIQEVSADAGTTSYAYDHADNMTQMIDARGVVTNYVYDALNRLVEVRYPNDASRNITYNYDLGTHGKGRLTSILDDSGQINYSYDHRGNVTQDSRIVGTEPYVTNYTYDLADNVQTMTYPGGRILTYERDAAGRVLKIKEGAAVLIDNVAYHPFGRAVAWDYENGLTQRFTIDLDGRIEERNLRDGASVVEDWDYNYDAVHNIDDIMKPGGTDDYGYDELYRLDEQTPIGQAKITYVYDAVGNRVSETQSGSSKLYTYDTTSNRLLTQDGDNVSHDDAGNRLGDNNGARTFTYNPQGRMVTVSSGSTLLASYLYNTLGQRVQKTESASDTQYVYDLNGMLIGEYNDGTLVREYIYLDGALVMQMAGATTTYLHPDHLGTPRTGTNSAKAIVWRWDGEAFGSELADADPDNDTVDTVVNLRFPGQYYDDESGLHYNYFRTYDPSIGRYTQSDPIGLQGGLNTYTYAYDDPVNLTDPSGLRPATHGNCGGAPGCTMNNQSGPSRGRVGVFGCAGLFCGSALVGDTAPQATQALALGGGLSFCIDDPHPKPEESCMEDEVKDCGIYDPNCDNEVGGTAGPPGMLGLMIGVSTGHGGQLCLNIGPHISVPGPVLHLGSD